MSTYLNITDEIAPRLNRRAFLGAAFGTAIAASTQTGLAGESKGSVVPAADVRALDLNALSDQQALKTYLKMIGSLEPAVLYTWFSGHLWGIVPGTPAKQLVSFEGIAKNVWRHTGDEITKQSFDIGYFGDAHTGELIDAYENPYTGKIVQPYHYAYGGRVTRYAKTGKVVDGDIAPIRHKWTMSGDQAWFEETNSLSVPNPFDPKDWPLASAGKELHFGSSTTNTAKIDDLLNPKRASVPYTLFWTAINSWEPWLHMADTPGYVMWRATGRKLGNLSEAPSTIIDYVNKMQPNYFSDDSPWTGTRSTWADYRRDRKHKS